MWWLFDRFLTGPTLFLSSESGVNLSIVLLGSGCATEVCIVLSPSGISMTRRTSCHLSTNLVFVNINVTLQCLTRIPITDIKFQKLQSPSWILTKKLSVRRPVKKIQHILCSLQFHYVFYKNLPLSQSNLYKMYFTRRAQPLMYLLLWNIATFSFDKRPSYGYQYRISK
jgi:hypothetical protein